MKTVAPMGFLVFFVGVVVGFPMVVGTHFTFLLLVV